MAETAPPYLYFEDINWGLLRVWGQRRGLEVLDVGCGFATTSQRVQELGNKVTGVEQSPEAVPVAGQRLERVVAKDLQDIEGVARDLGGARFDAIIFADVLEHLAWPLPVLQAYLAFLKPGGSVMVSLPNVGLWSVRLAHLFGRWNYQDTGVLDRTHLRFFTRKTARRMLAEAGLRVDATTHNPGLARPFIPAVKRLLAKPPAADAPHDPAALLNSSAYKLYLKAVHPPERLLTALWPSGLAFQMIFEARKEEA
jgi:2-polyprenyl-3-methyl-5-hydroxy-6-metoxy-1,4-benzoquinol methylase